MISKHGNYSIYFYCLEFGEESELLSVTKDWAFGFEEIGFEVVVIATHTRIGSNPSSIRVIELGGGTFWFRARALIRLFRVLIEILQKRKACSVFYHMNHKALALQGWALKAFRVHQTLWYSHAKHDKWLYAANNFADLIMTTNREAYPLVHSSIIPVGQAVNHQRFKRVEKSIKEINSVIEIVSVGRVSRAKALENIFYELTPVAKKRKIVLHFYGPILDRKYADELEMLARESNIELEFRETVKYQELPTILQKYNLYFTGTEKAIDKAAVEAAMSGLIILSNNMNLLRILGLSSFYELADGQHFAIENQLNSLLEVDRETLNTLSRALSDTAVSRFSISNSINEYLQITKLKMCE